jgi:ATP-binding protein involved in chromosome partitioning
MTARAEVGQVVMVAGGKGGVGKTTVAAGLAFRLAARGARVGLVDADVSGPSVPVLLDLAGPVRVRDGAMVPPLAHDGEAGVRVMSSGLFGEGDKAFTWQGPLLRGVLRQFLRDVAWAAPDYLVVDTPPGTGETHTVVMDELAPDATVLVTTPQALAVADTRRSMAFFQAVAPVRAVVENMAELHCDHCGHRTRLAGVRGNGEDWLVPTFRLPAVLGPGLPWRHSERLRAELDGLAAILARTDDQESVVDTEDTRGGVPTW